MAGNVPITGYISPTDIINDVYSTHKEEFGQGGFRTVANNIERDAITTDRRKEGMLVYSILAGVTYQLQSDLTTWTAYNPGGGGGSLTLNGDTSGTGTVPGTITTTLASIIAAATKGSATKSPTISVNTKGLVISIGDQDIQIVLSQVTGLVAALAAKADDSDVGVTIAPLVAGLVPLANLPFGAQAYQGFYNGTTNTPALVNGVGTAGFFYITSVAGAAGVMGAVVVNQIVAYDGAVWQAGGVFGGGILNVVTDAGTFSTSTVTINTTAHMAPQLDRQYQTDLQRQIQNATVAAGASVANRYATLADIGSGIVVTNEWNTPELYEDGLNSLGEGTISTQMMNTLTNPITSLPYDDGSMLAAYTFLPPTATAATWTYADVCVETAFRRMELAFGSAAITFHDNRIYQYNQEHVMPTVSQWSSFYRPNMWLYQGNSSRHYNRSGVAKRLWYRLPPNQTEAVLSSNPYTSVKTAMYNMSFFGAGLGVKDSGDTCVMIGATYGTIIKNCTFSSADVGLAIYFCLHARVEGGDLGGNSRSGILVATGAGTGGSPIWTGASLTNSASNGTWLSPTNINCANNSFAGIEVYGSDGVSVGGDAQIAFEGGSGSSCQHHIFMDGQASQLVKMFKARNFHLEQSVSESHICIKDYGQVITAYLGEVSPFLTDTGEPMFEARTNPAGGGTVQMVISDCPNLDVGWKLRQVGTGSSGRWTISMCQLYNQDDIYDPINWNTNTIAGLAGSIPPSPFAQIIAKTP